jgi:signal transduction histidine kinase/ActR/RegA family two-component response regulator
VLRDVPTRLLLVAGFLAAALVPLLFVALVSYEASRGALKQAAFAQLESTRTLEQAAIERAFEARLHEASVLAADPYVATAFDELCAAYRSAGGAAGRAVIGHDRRRFDAPADYRAVHDRHAPYLSRWVDEQGYYDLLLLDAKNGETCYSVQKESDFAQVVAEQPTSLRDVWREVTATRKPALSDTRPYAPSSNAAAQFVAAPIVEHGAVVGVVALQISIDSIDRVMGERAGMGRTGDSYLLGADGRLRSDSQLDRKRTVDGAFRGELVPGAVDEEARRRALAGETGSGVLRERDGRAVLAAWAPVRLGGITWAIVVVHGEDEIDAQIARALNTKVVLLFFGACAASVLLALSVSLAIARAVRDASAQVGKLGDAVLAGDLAARGDPEAVAHDLRDVVRRVNGLVDALVQVHDDKRRLEERIGRMQRLEAIGTLAGGIAHDFNNILTSLFAHVDILEGELPKDGPAAARLRQVDAGLQRAADLVRQILTFSRKLAASPRAIDLGDAAREAQALVEAGLPGNVHVVLRVPARALPVRADPTQLHQVLVNLLINASQALGEDGGEIELACDEETIAESDPARAPALALAPGAYCVVSVHDDGCGMDADTQARIFEPFFTTKPVGQGTGMGLALVHGVVTGAGGAVLVESSLGHGSTFRVYLPRGEVGVTDAARQHVAPAGQGRRVLFVDDEEHVCQAARQMLAALGFDPTTATSGREGIERFVAEPTVFDVVITDLSMPEVSGLEVVAAVRAARPGVPVILSTAHPDRLTRERALEVGFAEVLLKPYRKSALARVLAQVLDGAKRESSTMRVDAG